MGEAGITLSLRYFIFVVSIYVFLYFCYRKYYIKKWLIISGLIVFVIVSELAAIARSYLKAEEMYQFTLLYYICSFLMLIIIIFILLFLKKEGYNQRKSLLK